MNLLSRIARRLWPFARRRDLDAANGRILFLEKDLAGCRELLRSAERAAQEAQKQLNESEADKLRMQVVAKQITEIYLRLVGGHELPQALGRKVDDFIVGIRNMPDEARVVQITTPRLSIEKIDAPGKDRHVLSISHELVRFSFAMFLDPLLPPELAMGDILRHLGLSAEKSILAHFRDQSVLKHPAFATEKPNV